MASALDLIGDKWSLLILRALFAGASRFGDFMKQPERMATNIVTDRLNRLTEEGLVEAFADDAGVGRYRLSRSGSDLLPAMQALARWGYDHLPERWEPPDWFMKAKPTDFYPESSPRSDERNRERSGRTR